MHNTNARVRFNRVVLLAQHLAVENIRRTIQSLQLTRHVHVWERGECALVGKLRGMLMSARQRASGRLRQAGAGNAESDDRVG